MKRKYIAIVLGLVLALSTGLTGCAGNTSGSTTDSAQSSETSGTSEGYVKTETASTTSEPDTDVLIQADYAGQTVSGEVTEITDNQITLKLSSEENQESDNSQDSEKSLDSENNKDNNGTDTKAILEIEVSDTTNITREFFGGPDGQTPPDGQAPSEGQAPQGEPPAKPDGEDQNGQTPPDGQAPSDGQAPQGEPPAKPDGEDQSGQTSANDENQGGQTSENRETQDTQELTIADISVGDIVEVTIDDEGNVTSVKISAGGANGSMPGEGQGAPGGAPGSQAADISYSAVNMYEEDTEVSGETIESMGTDEEAALISSGAAVNLEDMTITRDSDDSTGGDNASFYGVGAAVLTTQGTASVNNSTITTDAKGGAGVFSYGENSKVYVADTTINTTQDTSGGIHTAGGGTLYAYNLDVTTNGESSAAIRSDRGGGTMVVNGGSYTSNGKGSPAIYSTADIAVNNAELTATGSEAVCIEGKNSIHLFESDLTGNMPENEQNDCTWNVILYQSMSGDSVEGNSTFEMQGGTLTAKNGGMFYTTNTESTFILNDVDIQYAEENDFFLKCTGNSNARGWGSSGANGADCSFTAIDQEMEGNVLWDSISELDFYMTGSSTLTGAFLQDESNAGNGGDGYASLNIDKNALWIVTEDSTLTSLNCAGTIKDTEGKSVTVKGTDGTVYVQGDSSITITVDNYSDEAGMDGMSGATEWNDYAVEFPVN